MLKLFKSFIKRFYIVLIIAVIVNIPIVVLGVTKTNKAITLTGDITDISSFVKIENEYETKGSISSIYVKYYEKSTILQNLLAKLDHTNEIEELSESVTHLTALENYNSGLCQKNSAMMTSIITAYTKAKELDDNINIEYSFNGYTVTYYSLSSKFRIGDRLIKINDIDTSIGDLEFKNSLLSALKDEKEDNYVVIRDGVELSIKEKDFGSISIYPYYNINYDTIYPKINVAKTTTVGPSAGFLQSLAIYNKLIKDDITKGLKIAGTGTIDAYANIGIIGGIKEKIYTAFKRNVDVFFCPSENYDEAKEAYDSLNNKEKMALVKVETFSDAISYLENYGL